MNRTNDIVIVGGGLSGLAAAFTLEQAGITYTLIEVKPRLGGSIVSHQAGSFVMDGGLFAFPAVSDWDIPELIGLGEFKDICGEIKRPGASPLYFFHDGLQQLTDALAAKLKTGTIIQRMAVTSLGEGADGGYWICLENGLALAARGLIVAAPARYAERMFRTLAPDVSDVLLGYHYDDVTRVALGYTAQNRPDTPPSAPPDMTFCELASTDHPARVPAGGLLVQAGVRVPLPQTTAARVVEHVTEVMGWQPPDAHIAYYWRESHPLSISGPASALHRLDAMLPDHVALIGSCYQQGSLPERIEQAQAAARRLIAWLDA